MLFRSVINVDVEALSGEASLILSLGANLPLNPVVRVFDPDSGQWQAFATGVSDQLASAPAGSGGCPAITSANYQNGLSPALSCVRLKAQDGGSNDADGDVDGRVELIFDIARSQQDDESTGPDTVDTSPSKGGGLAGSALLLIMLMNLLNRYHGFLNRTRT